MIDPVISWVIRISLALLFVSAALHKLRDLSGFVASMRAYELAPSFAGPLLGGGLAGTEVAIAAGLLLPASVEVASTGAMLLLALYGLAIAVNLWRGIDEIDCGCGAAGTAVPLSTWLLLRNLVLAAGALALHFEPSARGFHWLDGVSIVGGVATIALAWMAGTRLASHRLVPAGQDLAAARVGGSR